MFGIGDRLAYRTVGWYTERLLATSIRWLGYATGDWRGKRVIGKANTCSMHQTPRGAGALPPLWSWYLKPGCAIILNKMKTYTGLVGKRRKRSKCFKPKPRRVLWPSQSVGAEHATHRLVEDGHASALQAVELERNAPSGAQILNEDVDHKCLWPRRCE